MLPVVIAVHPRIVGPMVIAMGSLSLFQVLYYLRAERSLNFVYGALFWIFPYAVATARARMAHSLNPGLS